MPIRGAIRHFSTLVLAGTLAACAAPAPAPIQQAGHPVKGVADAALERFDLSTILKTVDRGSFCQLGGGGRSGGSDRRHVGWTVTCPRVGGDRTIYFELEDAIEAELGRIATVEGKSAGSGDAPDPISATLDVRGNAYLGTVRILGVNGNANITTFVDVDLAIP